MAAVSDDPGVVDPAARRRLVALLASCAVLAPLLVVGQFRPWVLLDASSLQALRVFVVGFFPPRLSPEFLVETLRATWITVAIATAGLSFALLLAIPLALLATRQLSISAIGRDRMGALPRHARAALRGVLVAIRSIPEVVLALLFVRVVGLGPTAGVLAIGIAYGAMLAKVFCDIVESNDGHAAASLLANGSGRLAAFVYGTLPQCLAELSSYLIYRWECAVRASVVMGFVGAGGLGQATDTAMKMMAGDEVATLLLAFMALVSLADLVSAFVRRRLEVAAPRRLAARSIRSSIRRSARSSSPSLPSTSAPSSLRPGGRWAASSDPRSFDRRGLFFAAATVLSIAASFASLNLSLHDFLEEGSVAKMAEFVGGFAPPDVSTRLLARVVNGTAETIAMSLVGTSIAAVAGLFVALPASRPDGWSRAAARLVLNFLRAVPELVWAAILVIAVGLGPFAGTIALAVHTTGVLGRLYADTLENLPPGPADALRDNGAGGAAIFLYARLPQALPQFLSYALYRWENNIRAATVLGVVGAGGLGQMLFFSLSLFQMRQAATVILAMIGIVLLVDGVSHALRDRMSR